MNCVNLSVNLFS